MLLSTTVDWLDWCHMGALPIGSDKDHGYGSESCDYTLIVVIYLRPGHDDSGSDVVKTTSARTTP